MMKRGAVLSMAFFFSFVFLNILDAKATYAEDHKACLEDCYNRVRACVKNCKDNLSCLAGCGVAESKCIRRCGGVAIE